MEEASPGPAPQFAVSAALSLEAAPVYQTDREIFDFTDSRFIKPFPENQAHYPLLMPQDLDLITQAGSSALLVRIIFAIGLKYFLGRSTYLSCRIIELRHQNVITM